MSSQITLSQAVRSNLLSLQNTSSLLDTTQTRLATGNKVNSALDNPTSFFTAAGLNSRAADLSSLLDSVSNAIQTIQAANDGITAITKLIQSAQATANQAQQLSEQVVNATPATAGLITGGASSTVNVSGGAVLASAATLDAGAATVPVDLSGGSDAISFSIAVDGGSTQTVTIDSAAVGTYNTAHGTSLAANNLTGQDLADLVNEQVAPDVASFASGHLTFTSTTAGGGSSIAITGFTETAVGGASGIANNSATGTAAAAGAAINFSIAVDGGAPQPVSISSATVTAYNSAHSASLSASALSAADIAAIINDQVAPDVATAPGGVLTLTSATTGALSSLAITGFTTVGAATGSTGLADATVSGAAATSTTVPNPQRGALIAQYNGLLDQIDQVAADATYNGNNLLAGTTAQLKVVFNEQGTSQLVIGGKDATYAGLGLTKLGANDFDTNTSVTGILDTLKNAAATLRSDASSFGSNLSIVEARQDFTKAIINTLETGASHLTLADANEEAANLLALQTRQQLSTKALSLASQADQNVLRLLQ